jgi:hypothetical protein
MTEELKFYAIIKIENEDEKKIPIKYIDFDKKKIVYEQNGEIKEIDLNKVKSLNVEADKPILIID